MGAKLRISLETGKQKSDSTFANSYACSYLLIIVWSEWMANQASLLS